MVISFNVIYANIGVCNYNCEKLRKVNPPAAHYFSSAERRFVDAAFALDRGDKTFCSLFLQVSENLMNKAFEEISKR